MEDLFSIIYIFALIAYFVLSFAVATTAFILWAGGVMFILTIIAYKLKVFER